jgi:hypothetical protein
LIIQLRPQREAPAAGGDGGGDGGEEKGKGGEREVEGRGREEVAGAEEGKRT